MNLYKIHQRHRQAVGDTVDNGVTSVVLEFINLDALAPLSFILAGIRRPSTAVVCHLVILMKIQILSNYAKEHISTGDSQAGTPLAIRFHAANDGFEISLFK